MRCYIGRESTEREGEDGIETILLKRKLKLLLTTDKTQSRELASSLMCKRDSRQVIAFSKGKQKPCLIQIKKKASQMIQWGLIPIVT